MPKRNYQKELDAVIEQNAAEGIRPRLLIQSCCAPCSSYVMEYLSRYFDLTMYFYNPNMDSAGEYGKRAEELVRLTDELNKKLGSSIKVIVEEYDPESWETIAAGRESEPERGSRCRLCYELRLRKTAEYMAASGEYDYFATTLTLSPLKDAEALNDIAEQLAMQYNIRSLPSDFKKRNGYKRSIELSGEYNLYRQDYCGCRISRASRKGNDNGHM